MSERGFMAASTPRASATASGDHQKTTRFATVSDFMELVAQEVYVDVERLRFLAFHGIPDDRDQSLRGTVWKILLPRLRSSLRVPIGELREESAYASGVETVKVIRDELDMYQPDEPFFRKPAIRSRMEKVCVQYYSEHPNGMAARDPKILIQLYGPFIYTSRRSDSEVLFYTFMEMLELHNTFEAKERSFRRFMSLFRSQIPQLCAHFEEEELDSRKWVIAWHHSLFAKQLPLKSLLRLWDSYFSVNEGAFGLHLYVCLAVLKMYENELLDKTFPEIRAFMEVLPSLDIERVVGQALNFQMLE